MKTLELLFCLMAIMALFIGCGPAAAPVTPTPKAAPTATSTPAAYPLSTAIPTPSAYPLPTPALTPYP